jgi:hypothetical protein
MGNWNHIKNIPKIHEQHIWKARHQGITENSNTGHSTHTAECTNVEAQNIATYMHTTHNYILH